MPGQRRTTKKRDQRTPESERQYAEEIDNVVAEAARTITPYMSADDRMGIIARVARRAATLARDRQRRTMAPAILRIVSHQLRTILDHDELGPAARELLRDPPAPTAAQEARHAYIRGLPWMAQCWLQDVAPAPAVLDALVDLAAAYDDVQPTEQQGGYRLRYRTAQGGGSITIDKWTGSLTVVLPPLREEQPCSEDPSADIPCS